MNERSPRSTTLRAKGQGGLGRLNRDLDRAPGAPWMLSPRVGKDRMAHLKEEKDVLEARWPWARTSSLGTPHMASNYRGVPTARRARP